MTYSTDTLATRSRHVTARFDPILLVTTGVLALTGIVMIYSATKGKLTLAGIDPHYYLKRQVIFFAVSLVVLVAVSLFDYRRWEQLATACTWASCWPCWPCWPGSARAPTGPSAGSPVGPLQLQPSEFATLVLIVAIATYCARRPEGLEFRDLVRMVLMAGAADPAHHQAARPRHGHRVHGHPPGDAGRGRDARPLSGPPGRRRRGRRRVGRQPRAREALPDPAPDQLHLPQQRQPTVKYQVDQAKTAIAHGGIFGQGLFKGAQTNLAYVPYQQTDFIFSAVGEQLGFVGAGVLLVLYGILAWRILRTAQMAKDAFGRLLCSGVFALLMFSVFENVGMNMGIMPVAGIPLPFLSYGGSSMIGFMAAIGIVTSVHYRSSR